MREGTIRKCLIGLALAGAVVITEFSYKKQADRVAHDVADAERHTLRYLRTNDFIRGIDFYRTSGAQGTLVHLRQIHHNPLSKNPEIIKEEVKKEVGNVQTNLYNIVSGYAKRRHATVMLEGMTDRVDIENLKMRGMYEDIKLLVGETLGAGNLEPGFPPFPPIPLAPNATQAKKDEYTREIEEYNTQKREYDVRVKNARNIREEKAKKLQENIWYSWGAIRPLLSEKNISLIPSSSYEVYDKAFRRFLNILTNNLTGKGEKVLADPIIMGAREDEAVKRVALTMNETNRYVFMIYGGKHDFRDNVEAWNSANPSQKLSLITVTPKEYER